MGDYVDCGSSFCGLQHRLLATCIEFLPTNVSNCQIPCITTGCEQEIRHSVWCPVWICEEKPTTTSSSTTSTSTTSTTSVSTTTITTESTTVATTTKEWNPTTMSPIIPIPIEPIYFCHPTAFYISVLLNVFFGVLLLVIFYAKIKKCCKNCWERYRSKMKKRKQKREEQKQLEHLQRIHEQRRSILGPTGDSRFVPGAGRIIPEQMPGFGMQGEEARFREDGSDFQNIPLHPVNESYDPKQSSSSTKESSSMKESSLYSKKTKSTNSTKSTKSPSEPTRKTSKRSETGATSKTTGTTKVEVHPDEVLPQSFTKTSFTSFGKNLKEEEKPLLGRPRPKPSTSYKHGIPINTLADLSSVDQIFEAKAQQKYSAILSSESELSLDKVLGETGEQYSCDTDSSRSTLSRFDKIRMPFRRSKKK